MLGTFHGSISNQHLAAYLDEFVFRFNRRNSTSRWLLFERILLAAPNFLPPTLAQLARLGGPEPTRYPPGEFPQRRLLGAR